jgi:hypothetical protein
MGHICPKHVTNRPNLDYISLCYWEYYLTVKLCENDKSNHITLKISSYSVELDADIFFDKLQVPICHSYTTMQLSTCQNELKLALNTTEYIVVCNSANKCSSALRDWVWSFHRNNAQETITRFVIYFESGDIPLSYTSYVVLSDSLCRNMVAVRLYPWRIIQLMMRKLKIKPNHIYHLPDGFTA